MQAFKRGDLVSIKLPLRHRRWARILFRFGSFRLIEIVDQKPVAKGKRRKDV